MKLAFGLTCLISFFACAGAERQKGEMGSGSDNEATESAGNRRNLSSDTEYKHKKHYVTIVKPEDNVFDFVNGGTLEDQYKVLSGGRDSSIDHVMGMTFTQGGRVYDPADIQIVNKFSGVTRADPMPMGETLVTPPGGTESQFAKFFKLKADTLRYQGNRQPKHPVPPGDAAYFHHGQCTPNSGTSEDFDTFGPNMLYVMSHTCLYNLCLGGGGFDCIAILAGSAYYDNLSHTFSLTSDPAFAASFGTPLNLESEISGNELPPPIRATILGGTGSFEGIEGTVEIVTIAGTAGKNYYRTVRAGVEEYSLYDIGYKVQTFTVNSNMPLPTAP